MFVKLHEDDIEDIEGEEEEGLPPHDVVINEEENERDERYAVEGAVAEEGPPRQVQHRLAEQGAHPNHK